MNKNYLFKFYIMLAAFVMSLTACTDYDNDYDERKLAYTESFKDVFGNIDPSQDWSMAKSIKASVDLSNISGECTVTIYDKAPMSTHASILYRTNTNGGGNFNFNFDAPKSNKDVYVIIKDEKDFVALSEYAKLDAGILSVRPIRKVAGNPNSTITLGEKEAASVMGTYTGTTLNLIAAVNTNNFQRIWFNDGLTQSKDFNDVLTRKQISDQTQYFYIDGNDPYTFKRYKWNTTTSRYDFETTIGKSEWQAKYVYANYVHTDSEGYWCISYGTPAHYESQSGQIAYPDLYNIDGVATEWGASWKFEDIDPIVGIHSTPTGWASMSSPNILLSETNEISTGVFAERAHADCSGDLRYCNLAKWYNELDAEKGAEYILKEDGPVEFDVMYGGTDNDNQFGYFYYSDGTPLEEIYNRPHYILMESAMMNDNLMLDDAAYTEGGMALTSKMSAYCKTVDCPDLYGSEAEWKTNIETANHKITGRHYELAYFGEDGTEIQGKKNFPAGTHIVFFLIQRGQSATTNKGWQIEYAVPDYNLHQGKTWTATNGSCHGNSKYPYTTTSNPCGELDAVTYKWGDFTVLGFEDRGGDDDMNDILFFIKGNFRNDNEFKDLKDTKEDSYQWIVACEDLGGDDDYDFNDVVFGVQKYDTKTTQYQQYYDAEGNLVTTLPNVVEEDHYLKITPLAAGATMKSWIACHATGAEKKFEETHTLITGVDYSSIPSGSMPMLNTISKGKPGRSYIIPLTSDQASAFSMNTPGNFGVVVESKAGVKQDEVTTYTLKYDNEAGVAPQMIILPNGWAWPKERNSIGESYPSFKSWVVNKDFTDWWNDWDAIKGTGINVVK